MFCQALPNENYKNQMFQDDETFGGFWSGLGKALLPVASIGLNAIPGIGTAASIAINAGLAAGGAALDRLGQGGNKFSKFDSQLSAFNVQFDSILQKLENGSMSSDQARSLLDSTYKAWSDFKMSQSKNEDKDYLYKVEVQAFKPKFEQIEAAIVSAKGREQQAAAAAQQQSDLQNKQIQLLEQIAGNSPASSGIDKNTLLLLGGGALILFFLMR